MKYIRRQEVGAIQWRGNNLEEIRKVIPASNSFEIDVDTNAEIDGTVRSYLTITKIGYVGGSEIVYPTEWIVWDRLTNINKKLSILNNSLFEREIKLK